MPEILLDGLAFPECPRWHDGWLYFSDMHAGVVWKLAPNGSASKVIEVHGRPGGLGWGADGEMRIVSMLERRLLRLASGTLETVADLTPLTAVAANDMVIDRAGRAYIGNFGFDLDAGESPKPTVLVCVSPDGSARAAAGDVWFPNGAVITPDGTSLILAETFAARLTAFDIQPDGSLANRRVFAPLDGLYPDGICLDAEGAVWVACADGHKTVRVLEGGKIAQEIRHEGRHSFACMLGGADRRDLYICTATHHLPERTVKLRDGRIERVRVDVPGAGLP